MFVRAISGYGGRLEVGKVYEVDEAYRKPTPELFAKWKGSDYGGAPLIRVKDDTHRHGWQEAYIWRFELLASSNYSPDQCGDTDDDI
jgi:hypothetical protein